MKKRQNISITNKLKKMIHLSNFFTFIIIQRKIDSEHDVQKVEEI